MICVKRVYEPTAVEDGARFLVDHLARDESKFNRFRLVVQTANPDQESDQLFHSFESLSHKDERTHLHVLPKGGVPNFFSHAPHAD